jgi:hypothetical protein
MNKLKYAWDIVLEKQLTAQELQAVNEISQILSLGGEVKEIKQKLALIK